jgi:hypothetical protein
MISIHTLKNGTPLTMGKWNCNGSHKFSKETALHNREPLAGLARIVVDGKPTLLDLSKLMGKIYNTSEDGANTFALLGLLGC